MQNLDKIAIVIAAVIILGGIALTLLGGDPGQDADDLLVDRPADREVALGLDSLAGGPGQARFRLGDVGAGHLADLESVLRGLELASDDLLVVDPQI